MTIMEAVLLRPRNRDPQTSSGELVAFSLKSGRNLLRFDLEDVRLGLDLGPRSELRTNFVA